MLSKNQVLCKDMTQDAGGIVDQIFQTMKELKTKLHFIHCRGDVKKPGTFSEDPISHVMSTCDTNSKEVRRELCGMNRIKHLEISLPNQIALDRMPDHRSMQELVRTTDSLNELRI